MTTATAIPAWVERFVGIPWKVKGRSFDGVDCWGLLWLTMREQYGITLPSYDGSYHDIEDGEWLSTLLRHGIKAGAWKTVEPAFVREGDGVLLRVLGPREIHVGLVVADGLFLHIMDKYASSVVDRLDHPFWANRVIGYYRHPLRL